MLVHLSFSLISSSLYLQYGVHVEEKIRELCFFLMVSSFCIDFQRGNIHQRKTDYPNGKIW
jgi:hypothetical protein